MSNMNFIHKLMVALFLAACLHTPTSLAAADEGLANSAVGLLEKYCVACHGPDTKKGGLRLDSAAAFAAGGDSGEPLIGDSLETSLLYTRLVELGDMPPESSSQPTPEEKQLLKTWIEAGAPWLGAAAALAEQAEAVFRKHCYACHGRQRYETPDLDFEDYDALVRPRAAGLAQFVVAGDLNTSLVWKKIITGTMPPKSQPRLTEEEQATIQQWITAGAPAWPKRQAARPYVSEQETLEAILSHVKLLPSSARPHQRYFSFTHLHNNSLVTDEELALYKAALSKLINSLTWESEIVVPQPVDAKQTVYVVDLRDLDWTDEDHWSKLFERNDLRGQDRKIGYPYGIGFDRDLKLRDLSEEIMSQIGSHIAKARVRADWFVAKASRPPLYHELLELPDTADALEKLLGVDTVADFEAPDLMRGAVKRSKVSSHNRALDRHRGLHGPYWISYDFASSAGDGNLVLKPLGPKFQGNAFDDFAFVHDGGEIVFTLPNRLQGYLLVDGNKKRISVGPSNIVSDSNRWSGTTEVVTGISCIGCHKHGMVRFNDEIGKEFNRNGTLLEKIRDLYAPQDRMNERLRKDEESFLTALLEAVRPFLPVSTTAELRAFPYEPVGEVARRYHADLTVADVAAELDMDVKELQNAIGLNATVENVLGALKTDGVVKRETWEERDRGGNSQFQDVATQLKGVAAID